jgi:hypothetical protein
MKSERTKVEYPLWRKKVDKSLFEQGTTIPNWACDMWSIPKLFSGVTSKGDENSKVTIRFNQKTYQGTVTVALKGRANATFRLWFEEDMVMALRDTFLMSYMRTLEQGLLDKEEANDIEERIPFWEFLDIEFDSEHKTFKFTSHYTQHPSFPNLFKRLVGSPPVQKVYDEVEGKDSKRIYKTDWKPRSELQLEIGATNVIYMLIDTQDKLIYIGEAKNLIKRLSQNNHPSIPNWEFFRYDVLPDSLSSYRVTLERMMIRSYATVLGNKKDVESFSFSEYKLANDKIDK